MDRQILNITNNPMLLDELERFINNPTEVVIDNKSIENINRSRNVVEDIIGSDRAVYGVNTGFGNFAETKIKPETVAELQKNLVLSHAAGVGEPVPMDIVRLMMLLKIKSLSLGYSGCRFEIIKILTELLNKNVLPLIPGQGSVGASGDLAPLAHMALLMIGQGSAFISESISPDEQSWTKINGDMALKKAGIDPVVLEAKEGLAVLNGTQAMTAYALYSLIKIKNILKMADITDAMSLETLLKTLTPFDPRIQRIRSHPGQAIVAKNILRILKNSPIVESHKFSDHKVQDAYSLRCIPQVHGAVRDAVNFVETVISHEVTG